MKFSDQCWIDSIAQDALGVSPSRYDAPLTTYGQALSVFLDELCELLQDYIQIFNEKVALQQPELVFQVFRMGYGRPGIILLRNKDKLVISGDGGKITAKVVKVHAYNERSLDVLEFFAEPFDKRGNMVWKNALNQQIVTPEIVVRIYLSQFLVAGSDAYIPNEKNISNRASLIES